MGRLRWRIPGVRGLYDLRMTLDSLCRGAGAPNSVAGAFVVNDGEIIMGVDV